LGCCSGGTYCWCRVVIGCYCKILIIFVLIILDRLRIDSYLDCIENFTDFFRTPHLNR
jgi:hypothetical protein